MFLSAQNERCHIILNEAASFSSVSGGRGNARKNHTAGQHLLVQPQRLFGKHRELLVGNRVEVDAGKVVADIDHPLADALLVGHYPPAYKFTRTLWRVVISSESCPIRPNRKSDSSSTSSLSPSTKQSRACLLYTSPSPRDCS